MKNKKQVTFYNSSPTNPRKWFFNFVKAEKWGLGKLYLRYARKFSAGLDSSFGFSVSSGFSPSFSLYFPLLQQSVPPFSLLGFSSLTKFRYLSSCSSSFNFTYWSIGTVKSADIIFFYCPNILWSLNPNQCNKSYQAARGYRGKEREKTTKK